jgi:hypothetical protein
MVRTTQRTAPTPERLDHAMDIARGITAAVGTERIELVTLTRDRICLQPTAMDDGEQIAHTIGCDLPIDHRMFVPGHTLWTGDIDGLEVQVRSALRAPAGAGL